MLTVSSPVSDEGRLTDGRFCGKPVSEVGAGDVIS